MPQSMVYLGHEWYENDKKEATLDQLKDDIPDPLLSI